MDIFFSNRIEKLYNQLKSSLFSKTTINPFESRIIIVPSPAIKSWLLIEMAKDTDLRVAMGVEILLLDQAIEKLTLKRKLGNSLELGLMIEVEIKKMIYEQPENREKWQSLFDYLKIKKENPKISHQTEKRLNSLSQKLSSLFLQYGIYGGEMINSFEENSEDFQIELWKTIFLKKNWPYLQKELKENTLHSSLNNSDSTHVHLFSLSFISKAHYDFFCRVSKQVSVHYYFLSPCQAFWSDIRSDREQVQLQRYLQKISASSPKTTELDEYLRDQNPLLANFGKLGREMAKLIEMSDAVTESEYMISEGIAEYSQYQEFEFYEFDFEPGFLTLLKAIQADLSLLRNPSTDKKIVLDQDDDSIQIHVASSPSREIQILYDTLLALIKKNENENPILPGNIIVMAPDIMDYEPFIHSVFGSDESLLNYHVLDLHMPSQNKLVQSFNHLISLPQNRFSADSLLDLFNGSYFQTCHSLTIEEINQIRQWFADADLRWGLSHEDRNELITKDHCTKKIAGSSETGTLNYCLDRLLAAIAVGTLDDDTLNAELERLPIQGVEASDALLLGKLAKLIHSLKDDLRILSDGTEMTLKNWATYLDCLSLAYFGINETSDQLTNEELVLLNQFDEFRRASEKFKTELFSFNTIKSYLELGFKREKLDFQETELNSVRFCSMLPMRAVPAAVVVLIGMNEGAFPRNDTKNSLDLCQMSSLSDYSPSKTDYDRYLFLEALLSARQYFILSYVGYSLSESKETNGALVITELSEVIDSGYLIGEAKFSDVAIKKHPFNAYDSKYFEKKSGFISFSNFNYKLGLKFNDSQKTKKHQFISDFKTAEIEDTPLFNSTGSPYPELIIDLKELSNFARNPLKVYFNQTLGIYLKNHEPEFKVDEDFVISHLDLAIIKKSTLKNPLAHVFNLTEKKGLMPSGLFKKIAMEKIESDASSLKNHLKKLHINLEDLFTIDFFENCKAPVRSENGNWQLPPLEILFQNKLKIKITGSLTDVSPKGLIVHAKDSKVDVIKFWPQFLVFNALMHIHNIAEDKLIFAKCGKAKSWNAGNLEKHLENYLAYYFKGLKNPSPLIPEWVFDFVYQEDDSLNIKIDKSLNDDFNPLYNEYLHWIRNNIEIPSCKSFGEEWKIEAQNLFLDLFENWYAK